MPPDKYSEPQYWKENQELKAENEALRRRISALEAKKPPQKAKQVGSEALLTILDNINTAIYVTDIENYTVLYANKCARLYFGKLEGEKCWYAIHGNKEVCPVCAKAMPWGTSDKPFRARSWEFFHQKTNKWFRGYINVVQWIDGRMVRIEVISDISESKLAEKEIGKQKDFFNHFIENLPLGVFAKNVKDNFKFTLWNRAAEQITGQSKDNVLGKSDFELFPIVAEDFRSHDKKMLSKRTRSESEEKITDTAGQEKIVQMVKVPIFDAQGEPESIFGIINDISERKQAQERLEKLLKEQKIILENIGIGIAFLRQRKIIWANEQLAKLFEYPFQEIIDKSTSFFYPTQTDFEALGKKAYPVLSAGKIYSGEHKLKRKNGEIFWGHVTGQAIDPQQLDEGSIWLLKDIQERKKAENALKESEEKFRQMAENINEVFWLRTREKMIYVSPAFETVWERKRSEIYQNPNIFLQSIHPDDRQRIENVFYSPEYNKKGFFNEDYRIVTPEGKIKWISAKSYPVPAPGSQEPRTAGIASDITPRKHAEQALRKLNATKDKIFSIIAHDLRGSIGNFRSMLDVLLANRDTLNKQQRNQMLDTLRDTAGATFFLLENLLNWSRNQRGEIAFKPRALGLSEIVISNFTLLKANAQSKNIDFSYQISEDFSIFADPDMANTVLRNLIANAIKFTPRGGKIQLFTQKKDDFAQIWVQDNGIGISPENKKRLFVPNEYFSTAGTENEKGSGLGLPLCKDFVEKNNGEIFVESEPGKGSRFGFSIPLF